MTSRQQPTEPFPINVVIVGGGMITADQLLPSAYQLQRLGIVDQIIVQIRRGAGLLPRGKQREQLLDLQRRFEVLLQN